MKKIYNIDKPFVDGLNENILLIAKQSFHTMFFMKQLWYEINKKIEIKGFITEGMFPDHEPCSIPVKNKKFKIFPWNFNSFDVVLGDYEIDLISEYLGKDTDINHFLELQKEENLSRPSFTIKKIQSLIEDFVTNLEAISSKNDIPYPSITYLTRIITSGCDTKKIRDNEELLEPYFSILVPKALSKKEQENLILKLSNQMHQLLIEAFWVILLIDWIEFCKILNFAKSNTPYELKEYLIERAVYSPLKTIIKDIHCAKSKIYIEHQYKGAIKFYPLMIEFTKQNLLNIAIKYIEVENEEISFKSHVKPGSNPEAKREYTDANYDEYSLKIILDYFYTEKDEGQNKKKSASKYVSGKYESLAYDFLPGIVNKTNEGLLMSYKLTGEPTKLISYIQSIFYNNARTEIEKKRSSQIYKKLGIHLKTLKLYVEEIIQGKINIGRDIPKNFTFNDLTEEEIFKIIEEKRKHQEHEKDGFISQRALLSSLQNEIFLDGLKKKGHPLTKHGETTLKNALKKLKQDNKILFTKEKNAIYYQQTDVPSIADQLTNYFNSKRKK